MHILLPLHLSAAKKPSLIEAVDDVGLRRLVKRAVNRDELSVQRGAEAVDHNNDRE